MINVGLKGNVVKADKSFNKQWLMALIITFLICCIPRMLFAHMLIPYSVYDEGPALAAPAYFAGRDWTSITAISAYYGFGYYGLFAPIFKLTVDPYIIYFVIILVNIFVQVSYGLIAFVVMRKYLKLNNIFSVTIGSCICSYLTTVRPIIYNEIPLVLLNWTIALVLCYLVKNRMNKCKKNIGTILLFAMIAYALTIHTRAVILLLALLTVVLVYKSMYKEWIISIRAVLPGMIIVAAAKFLVAVVQNVVWGAAERNGVANTAIDLGLDRLDLFDLTTWKGFFLVFIGQISTINLFCGGLFVSALYILIKYAILNLKSFRDEENNRYYLILVVMFLLCCFSMVAGQAVSWMYSIYPSLINGEVGDVSGYKAFSYIRYMGAFIGPIILCALVIVNKNSLFMREVDIARVILVNLLVLWLWMTYVLPLLDSNPHALEAYAPFCFRKAHDAIGLEQYRVALPWYLIICFFLVISGFKRNSKIYYVFVLSLLIFQVTYMAKYNDSYYGKERSKTAAICYEFLEKLSEQCQIPETIYAYNTDVQRLQFYLNCYQIEPDIPEHISQKTILIYQGKLSELTDIDLKEWNYISLGNNVYFLFQQEEYKKHILALGYEIL